MSSRYEDAVSLIDAANSDDPNLVETDSGQRPAELVYSERMSETLERFDGQASEELRLAVRAQHLMRWTLPRSDFPMDRKGYLAWRNAAKDMHANEAGQFMAQAGYGEDSIERVRNLIRKVGLKRNAETQTLEDVACLVFLEHYFSDFSGQHEREKMLGIVRKTWAKMSGKAREEALKLPMSAADASLVEEALANEAE